MSLALQTDVAFSQLGEDLNCDRSLEIRRLRRNLLTHLHAHPHIEPLGEDNLAEAIAVELGLSLNEISLQRVCVRGNRRHTLACVLSRLWHDPRGSEALKALKRAADAGGRGLILVPEGAVHRQPRLGRARAIESALGVQVTAEDRLAVLVHLIDVGYSTLMDCASVVRGEAPVSIVLCLVAEGAIRMHGGALHPEVRIDLPAEGFWAQG